MLVMLVMQNYQDQKRLLKTESCGTAEGNLVIAVRYRWHSGFKARDAPTIGRIERP